MLQNSTVPVTISPSGGRPAGAAPLMEAPGNSFFAFGADDYLPNGFSYSRYDATNNGHSSHSPLLDSQASGWSSPRSRLGDLMGSTEGSHSTTPPLPVPRSSKSAPGSRRNSDGNIDIDSWARASETKSKEEVGLPQLHIPPPYDERASRRPFDGLIRRDSYGNSPGVPPQFSANFLMDDDELATSPQVSSSYVRKYLQQVHDNTRFPVLVRRDSLNGALSAASAALDLAPLEQTRRGSRGSLRSELQTWEAVRAASAERLSSSGSKEDLRKLASESSYVPRDDRERSHNADRQYFMNRQVSPTPEINQKVSQQPEWLEPLPNGNGLRRMVPKSVSVPSNLNDTFEEAAGPASSARVLDDGGWVVRPPPGFVCRFFRNGYCSRGDRCKFPHNAPANPPTGPNALSNGNQFLSPARQPGGNVAPQATVSEPVKTGNSSASHRTPQKSPGKGNATTPAHKRTPSDSPRYPPLEQLKGQLYSLCKDQHGCRYLQKKLEDNEPGHATQIFNEVYEHILELMSDPFGNYLCQKLFSYCDEEQKTKIARKAAPGLVAVSLNMHGTRSVQKLIDCLTTPYQIKIVIEALRGSVVPLIKDLNGNHVIQKCLNKLTAEQNQFIYDAVTENCVAVASHRHGCCVLQRCIDHASEAQKIQLATEITFNALTLVQDAFGNYVVQYILDLKIPRFSDALIRRFLGHVYELSLQKFSSNVIEKCIRVAEPDTRRGLIAGLLDRDRLPHLLQDSFANYVVQTSLDVSDNDQYVLLAEMIRPMLPSIRHLPYCKRIQSKLNRDAFASMDHSTSPPTSELHSYHISDGGRELHHHQFRGSPPS